jgi:hypothetical protein
MKSKYIAFFEDKIECFCEIHYQRQFKVARYIQKPVRFVKLENDTDVECITCLNIKKSEENKK